MTKLLFILPSGFPLDPEIPLKKSGSPPSFPFLLLFPFFSSFFMAVALQSKKNLTHFRPCSSLKFQHRPFVLFSESIAEPSSWTNQFQTQLSVLKKELPANIHLLALKTAEGSGWKNATVRMQHIFEKQGGERGGERAKESMVVPEEIFEGSYEVSEERELGGMAPMEQRERWRWHSEPADLLHELYWQQVRREARRSPSQPVSLAPMQIKTFAFSFR